MVQHIKIPPILKSWLFWHYLQEKNPMTNENFPDKETSCNTTVSFFFFYSFLLENYSKQAEAVLPKVKTEKNRIHQEYGENARELMAMISNLVEIWRTLHPLLGQHISGLDH